MDLNSVNRFPREMVDSLLDSVPFFRTIRQMDSYQYDLLLRSSSLVEFSPGEIVLEKGQRDESVYFLLKGQLEVHSGRTGTQGPIVNHITPGEVFGDLAILFDFVRTATVVADASAKRVLTFATPAKTFGSLEDLHPISLRTKLLYYRNMVHNLRWKLEVYRAAHPDQAFASEHRKIKLFAGAKDSMEELRSLDQQARELATLLVAWNDEIDRKATVDKPDISVSAQTSA